MNITGCPPKANQKLIERPPKAHQEENISIAAKSVPKATQKPRKPNAHKSPPTRPKPSTSPPRGQSIFLMLSNRTPNTYIKSSLVALIRVMNQSNTCAHQKPIKSGLGWAETVPTKSQSKADLKTNENPCQVHQKRTPPETENKSPPNAKAHTSKRPSKVLPNTN